MARLLLFVVAASTVVLALPAAAQQRRPETPEEAGLRYLDWPGRPPVNSRPARAERPAAPRPRTTPTPRPQPEPEVPAQVTPPEVRAEAPAATPPTTTTGESVRYYSVHRQAGRTPDTIDRARVLAADQTLVALQSPQGQTLAEQERSSRAEEAFEILRNLPPDQLMEMLGRQP